MGGFASCMGGSRPPFPPGAPIPLDTPVPPTHATFNFTPMAVAALSERGATAIAKSG
jgi:hypothetical protein